MLFVVEHFGDPMPDAIGVNPGEKIVRHRTVTVGGSSVHFDTSFLRSDMPGLHTFFHHRLLDVSALRVISDLWYPEAQFHDENACVHEALADVRHSIARLKHYQAHLLGVR